MARYHISEDGQPRLCKAQTADKCPTAGPGGSDAPHGDFDSLEDAQKFAETINAAHAENPLGTTSRSSRLSPEEQKLRARNIELVKKLVETRADNGDVTFEDANPERSSRRLQEAVAFAESRSNIELANKLASAKVLPSGAFQRKSDKKRVNTDNAIKTHRALKAMDAGRKAFERSIQKAIDSGAIEEGKYSFKDDSGSYSLTVSKGYHENRFEELDEATKAAISSEKPSLNMELAREKLNPETLSKITAKTQVMDFILGNVKDLDEVKPVTTITGDDSKARAENALANLSAFTQEGEKVYGSKKELTATKAENAEIIKSAVASNSQNTFVPGRAYANGALISNRTSIVGKLAEAELTAKELKSITTTVSSPDPEKAKKILAPEVFAHIFESPKVSIRVTPKRAPKVS